jgi:hypothetical protein
MLQKTTREKFVSIPLDDPAGAGDRALWWVPWALALFFCLWSLRAVGAGNLFDTDAARHALNGAFLHDLIRDGALLHPIEYGKTYYGKLPALSMPYHPPLFPAMEALFFAIFGVGVTTARVLVALTTGLSAYLFYRLVLLTHGSHLLALCSVSAFCFWSGSQFVAGDVMLEFPSMMFLCAALLCLRDMDRGLRWKHALAFAMFAAAAVWTKQHAVFLGLVPFAYYLFRLRLPLLFQKSLLAAAVLFGFCVIALARLSAPFQGTGADQVAPPGERLEIAVFNTLFYLNSFRDLVGTIPAILIGCAVVAAAVLRASGAWERKQSLALYWAWAASAFAVLLGIGAYSPRYLFYVYPACAVIVFASLFRLSSRFSQSRSWWVPTVVMLGCAVAGLTVRAPFLRGPSEAAELIMANQPRRILYCGTSDGHFIFQVRVLDPRLATTVIPGDKLSEKELSPEEFDRFAARHGIQYVVLEKTVRRQVYDRLHEAPTASMVLERRIPLASVYPRWDGGHLSVYRIRNLPAASPEPLNLPVPKIDAEVQVRF